MKFEVKVFEWVGGFQWEVLGGDGTPLAASWCATRERAEAAARVEMVRLGGVMPGGVMPGGTTNRGNGHV